MKKKKNILEFLSQKSIFWVPDYCPPLVKTSNFSSKGGGAIIRQLRVYDNLKFWLFQIFPRQNRFYNLTMTWTGSLILKRNFPKRNINSQISRNKCLKLFFVNLKITIKVLKYTLFFENQKLKKNATQNWNVLASFAPKNSNPLRKSFGWRFAKTWAQNCLNFICQEPPKGC